MDTAASGLDAFGKLAPYLQHPLVLIGFVLFLVFGVHRLLIKSGIIPPVDQTTGGRLLARILNFGFVIAILVVILGFALAYLRPDEIRRETEQAKNVLEQRVQALQLEAHLKDATIRTLNGAVDALAAKASAPGARQSVKDALASLAKGDTAGAERIFQAIVDEKAAEGTAAFAEAAEAARRLGALAYLNDTRKALAAYRRAAELDPNDFATWIFIARLEQRSGDLADAEQAARRALAVAERAQDDRSVSVAQDDLGDVKRAQGDLPAALAAFDASLAIRKRLAEADPGNAEWQRDLSVSWDRIGDVKRAQGDLPAALAAFDASLAIGKRLAEADPGNAEWQRDLIVSHVKLAEWFSEQPGGAAQVRQHYRQALDVVRTLQAGTRLNPAPMLGWSMSWSDDWRRRRRLGGKLRRPSRSASRRRSGR